MTAVGLLLPTRDALMDGRPQAAPLLRLAEQAEAAGLDSVWVGDSPLARPRHDAFAVLAAVAATTTRVLVGTAVLLAPVRHPLLLLHAAATVDQIAEGRLVLGLGSGFPMPQTEAQFEALDADYRRRASRLEDTVRLARHLWREQSPAPFEGRTIRIDEPMVAPGPHRPGGPPIWLAGGTGTAARIGQLADGWLPYPPTPEEYVDGLGRVQRHAACAGRAVPTAALYATVTVDDDPERARRTADEHLERYYETDPSLVRLVQATFAGTHDDVVEQLRAYCRAGAEHLVIRIAGPMSRETIDWLADLRRRLRAELRPTPPAHHAATEEIR